MRFVRGVARIAFWLAVVSVACALLIALALYDEGWWVVLAVVAAVPAVVLFLFSFALKELAELPERLRNAPAEARGLRSAFEEVARTRGSRRARALSRAARQAVGARDLATPWAPVVAVANVPFLIATGISALLIPFEVLLALVVLVVSS